MDSLWCPLCSFLVKTYKAAHDWSFQQEIPLATNHVLFVAIHYVFLLPTQITNVVCQNNKTNGKRNKGLA